MCRVSSVRRVPCAPLALDRWDVGRNAHVKCSSKQMRLPVEVLYRESCAARHVVEHVCMYEGLEYSTFACSILSVHSHAV
jgi:hypothetical protein